MTRAPTEGDESPGFSTMPAPSLPKIRGAVALGYAPDRMVWSRGLTPAAVIRTSTLPAANVGLGTSTSFRPPYPLKDSALIAFITPPFPCPRYGLVERGRGRTKCSLQRSRRA